MKREGEGEGEGEGEVKCQPDKILFWICSKPTEYFLSMWLI
jgi:hypothetical protein